MTAHDQERIGLIADSHGNLEATAGAIRLLKGRGADLIVHLGDFCDSVRHDRAAAMIALIEDHGILAVKGNNDFLVENLLAENCRPSGPDVHTILDFLRTVPVTRSLDGLRFAHSLPFDSLRSFYEPIDRGNTLRAAQLFAEADFEILFCGHSHLPVLFRKAGGRVTREAMAAGESLSLATGGAAQRFIVVVGAAENGECALYDRSAATYERLRIFA
jgi:predicted phosphodiesterase